MFQNFSVFQVTILSTFGALAVAGVLVFAFLIGGNAGSSVGPVEIWGTLDSGAFTTVMRQLAEEESRFRQVTYVQKNPETFNRELTDALAAGTGPQLYLLRQDYVQREIPKTVIIPFESFSKEQFESTFIQGSETFLTNEGVLAVPLVVDPLVAYWNKDLFSTSGVAKPPTYWDELFELATAATKRNPTNSIEKSGVALGEYTNINHAKSIVTLLMMQAGGRITTRDSSGKLTPSMVARVGDSQQAADSALRFYTDFANPVKTHYSWNRSLPESRSMFGNGDLALYIGLVSEEPLVRRINPNLNFAIAPIPQIRGEATTMNSGFVYGLAIPKANTNTQGALTIAYLLAGEGPSQLISQALGLPSARRDVLSKSATGNDELFAKQALLMRSWIDPDPEKTNVIFRDMIQNVTSGALKQSEAIQRADRALGDAAKDL